VFDVLHTELLNFKLDSVLTFLTDFVFKAKEDLALSVKNALMQTLTKYRYQILQVLITVLDPYRRVKNAMNEINSFKRLEFAVVECAEGE
jgi:regulator of protease activity HflC (stomatin/prohibitin superfamily)